MISLLYATAVVQLLYPLLDLGLFDTSCLSSIVWQHTQQGLAVVDSYRAHYSCAYQPVLQVFAVLNLTDVIVRFFPKINRELGKDDEEAVKLATEVLEQSLLTFPVAAIFTEKFREITKKVLFPWPSKLDNLVYHQRSKSRSLLMKSLMLVPGPPTFNRSVLYKKDLRQAYNRTGQCYPPD